MTGTNRKPTTREIVWVGDRGEGTVFYRLKQSKDGEIRRASANLYLSYRAENREHVVSAHTPDLADAKRELRRLTRNRDNAKEGKEPLATPKAERVKVQEIVAAYLDDREFEEKRESIKSMRDHAKPVLAALGGVRALELRPEHVARYKKLRRASVSDAKISRELEILKAAFNFAAEQGRIRVVPVIKLPHVDNARQVFFPLERIPELLETLAKLADDCKPRYRDGFLRARDFLHWQSFGGMRPKAIRLLQWAYLDEKDWVLTLPAGEDKNRAGRELDVSGEAREILERRLKARRPGDVYIFGGPKPIANKLVWRVWNLALERMGLPSGQEAGFTPYDLKKTALRALRRAGIPEERAMYFSGHVTPSTFRRYNITSRDDNREDMQKATEYRRRRFAHTQAADADTGAKLLRIPAK
jgi:integrase